MPKSRGRTSTESRSARFHLDATPPTRHAGLFHHGGSLSSADSGSLNHFSHPTSPLLTGRTGTSRRTGRAAPLNTVVNEHGVVTLQISDNDLDQPVYQVTHYAS